METQLIREQVFDVLFNYVKRADGIYTESDCATVRDEICLQIDQSQFTADEAEEFINQEVERRIKERMPTKDNENKEIKRRIGYDEAMGYTLNECKSLEKGIRFGFRFYRSRLTCSEIPNNSKTEGGGE